MMFLYKRNMSVDIFVRDDNTAKVVSRLEIGAPSENKAYRYQIWAEIESGTMTIRDAGVDHLTAEAPDCEGAKALMQRMKGLRLDEKYVWRISNLLGRSNGCRHLYELALEIARAYSNLKLGEYMLARRDSPAEQVAILIDLKSHCAGLAALSREGALS